MFPPVSPAGAVKSDAGRRSNKKVQENATTKTYYEKDCRNKSAKTKSKATTETDEKATNTIIKGERQNKTHTTKTIYKTRTKTTQLDKRRTNKTTQQMINDKTKKARAVSLGVAKIAQQGLPVASASRPREHPL